MDLHRRNTTCGISNSVFIYIFGVLSLIEAVTFVTVNTFIFLYIDERHDIHSDIWWIDNDIRPQHITLLFIPFNTLRIFAALALLIGRPTNNSTSLPFYIIVTFLGVGANLGAGAVAVGFPITFNIGVATLCIVVLHVIYILVGSKIFLQERAASRRKFDINERVGNR